MTEQELSLGTLLIEAEQAEAGSDEQTPAPIPQCPKPTGQLTDGKISCTPPSIRPSSLVPLPPTSPKKFFQKKSFTPVEIAESLVEFFSQSTEGLTEEMVHYRDGSSKTVLRPYHRPLPLLAEYCHAQGFTVSELEELAAQFPASIGRALQMARESIKTYLIHAGLDGRAPAPFAIFVATNETDMKSKSEVESKSLDLDKLIDRITKETRPAQTARVVKSTKR